MAHSSETRDGLRGLKVWNADRTQIISVSALTIDELRDDVCIQFGNIYQANRSKLRVVLESDGAEVTNELLRAAMITDSSLVVLLPHENWVPASVDAIRIVINAIPQIVCEAMRSLELFNTAPTWKIMEHRGRVTVVLSWEPQDRKPRAPEFKLEVHPDVVMPPAPPPKTSAPTVPPSAAATSNTLQTGTKHSTATYSRSKSPIPPSPAQTATAVSSTAAWSQFERERHMELLTRLAHAKRSTHRPPSDLFRRSEKDPLRERTERRKRHSSHQDRHGHEQDCDFHCSALHQQQHKATLSSPVIDLPEMALGPPGVFGHGGGGMPIPPSAKNVHFEATAKTTPKPSSSADPVTAAAAAAAAATSATTTAAASTASGVVGAAPGVGCTTGTGVVSSSSTSGFAQENQQLNNESESQDDDELLNRYLLLVDDLAGGSREMDHLTVKDIGAILDILSSRVVDVDKLEREKETSDIHNWTIKATIRGGNLVTEVGLVYKGRYLCLVDHPGYFFAKPLAPPADDCPAF